MYHCYSYLLLLAMNCCFSLPRDNLHSTIISKTLFRTPPSFITSLFGRSFFCPAHIHLSSGKNTLMFPREPLWPPTTCHYATVEFCRADSTTGSRQASKLAWPVDASHPTVHRDWFRMGT